MVVAFDGPAGSGKSTVAKRIALSLGGVFINSGQMYRYVTHRAIEASGQETMENLVHIADSTSWSINEGSLWINGAPPGSELHRDAIDANVSRISAVPELRLSINRAIRNLSRTGIIVVEGRDMTTVAFPDAEYKFFIDASAQARARRRFLQGTSKLSEAEILLSIQRRDEEDRNKRVGSLKYTEGTTYIDTSDLTMDEVCDTILKSIQGN